MSRVALLIPVYNNRAGLEASLASIGNDKVSPDVIIVDDGSNPPIAEGGIPASLRSCCDRLQVLRIPENRGITSALNLGIGVILGEDYKYIARLDAGDLSLPGRFAKQFTFLETHPEYAMVGGQVKFVDRSGKEVFQERFPTRYEDIRRIMHARNCFIHPAVMIRTDVLRKVGVYSDDYPAAEDYELFMRITQRYPVANLEDDVVICELNPAGISMKRRRRQILSRSKVMIRYFDPKVKESYLGLLKNLFLLFMPYAAVVRAKSVFREKRGWL